MGSFMQHAFQAIEDAKHRLGEKVWVEYSPTEYRQDDWGEWQCQHPSVHNEKLAHNYMTFSGAEQYEYDVRVCDDCDETVEEWDEVI